MPYKDPEARRRYHTEYMRKRRENKELKRRELDLQAKARDCDEFRAKDAEYKRTQRREDGDKVREAERQSYKKNSARYKAKVSKRRAAQLQAIPAWADMDAINFVYHAAKAIEDEYGTKWHVDHIVPLQGSDVCGLHVADNLQLLSPDANLRKSNKWENV